MKNLKQITQLGFNLYPNVQERRETQYSIKKYEKLEEKVQEKPKSFYDGKYHGYSVKLQVVRENLNYEPYQIRNPEDVYNFLSYLETQDKEQFLSILLDTKNRVLGVDEVSVGTLNASAVDPREVFKTAVLYNSASLILAHNHPSGDPTPSKSDIDITKQLKRGAKLLGLNLLDHVIIGYKKYKSVKEEGLL